MRRASDRRVGVVPRTPGPSIAAWRVMEEGGRRWPNVAEGGQTLPDKDVAYMRDAALLEGQEATEPILDTAHPVVHHRRRRHRR
jgi:hypothetical protein